MRKQEGIKWMSILQLYLQRYDRAPALEINATEGKITCVLSGVMNEFHIPQCLKKRAVSDMPT